MILKIYPRTMDYRQHVSYNYSAVESIYRKKKPQTQTDIFRDQWSSQIIWDIEALTRIPLELLVLTLWLFPQHPMVWETGVQELSFTDSSFLPRLVVH